MKNVRLSLFTNGSKLAIAILLTGAFGFGTAIQGHTARGGATGGNSGHFLVSRDGGMLVTSDTHIGGIRVGVTSTGHLLWSGVDGVAIHLGIGGYQSLGVLDGSGGGNEIGKRGLGIYDCEMLLGVRKGEPPGAGLHLQTEVASGVGLTRFGDEHAQGGISIYNHGTMTTT
jgi:hypothetical protein